MGGAVTRTVRVQRVVRGDVDEAKARVRVPLAALEPAVPRQSRGEARRGRGPRSGQGSWRMATGSKRNSTSADTGSSGRSRKTGGREAGDALKTPLVVVVAPFEACHLLLAGDLRGGGGRYCGGQLYASACRAIAIAARGSRGRLSAVRRHEGAGEREESRTGERLACECSAQFVCTWIRRSSAPLGTGLAGTKGERRAQA